MKKTTVLSILAVTLFCIAPKTFAEAVLCYTGCSSNQYGQYQDSSSSKNISVGSSVTSLGNFTYSSNGSYVLNKPNTESNLLKHFELSVSGNKFTCTNPNGRWYNLTMQGFWGGVNPSTPIPNRTFLVSPAPGGTPNGSSRTGAFGSSTINYESTIGCGQSLSTRFFLPYNQSFCLEAVCQQTRILASCAVFITE